MSIEGDTLTSAIPDRDLEGDTLTPAIPDRERIIRIRDVVTATGLSRTTIWRLIQSGGFPAPLWISEKCRGWRAGAVLDWLQSRVAVPHERA